MGSHAPMTVDSTLRQAQGRQGCRGSPSLGRPPKRLTRPSFLRPGPSIHTLRAIHLDGLMPSSTSVTPSVSPSIDLTGSTLFPCPVVASEDPATIAKHNPRQTAFSGPESACFFLFSMGGRAASRGKKGRNRENKRRCTVMCHAVSEQLSWALDFFRPQHFLARTLPDQTIGAQPTEDLDSMGEKHVQQKGGGGRPGKETR